MTGWLSWLLIWQEIEDPPLDLTSKEQKASCGNIKKAPHWEVPHERIKILSGPGEEPEDQEETEPKEEIRKTHWTMTVRTAYT